MAFAKPRRKGSGRRILYRGDNTCIGKGGIAEHEQHAVSSSRRFCAVERDVLLLVPLSPSSCLGDSSAVLFYPQEHDPLDESVGYRLIERKLQIALGSRVRSDRLFEHRIA